MEQIISEILKPTKFILDSENNKMIPFFDPIDEKEVEQISSYRWNICNSCSFLTKKMDSYRCNYCGCHLESKIKIIYPLDKDNKAIRNVMPNGEYIYVCKLKKW